MTEPTIKVTKGVHGYGLVWGFSQPFDFMVLRTHLQLLEAGEGNDSTLKVLRKFAKKYRLELRVVP